MKLLINFAPLKLGGGQNVGLNFINGLNEKDYSDIEFYFAAARGTKIEAELKKRGFKNILSLPASATKRMLKELTEEKNYIRNNNIDAVYSCFGHALISGKTCQICGVADSNLLYPEIDFWEGYRGIERFRKWLIDEYRKWGYRRAAGLVFENAAMEARAKKVFGSNTDSVFIKPSFSISEEGIQEAIDIPKAQGLKALFLCGWQRNKGILMIPKLIREGQKQDLPMDFYISTTVDEENPVCNEFMKQVKLIDGVIDHIHFIGTVDKSQIADLYSKMDLVFLLSKLESFSNNIIESWYYKKPLIIADEEWSHGICNDAALYVDRGDAERIVIALKNANESGMLNEIVEAGSREFALYPTIKQKVDEEIQYVKKVYASFS